MYAVRVTLKIMWLVLCCSGHLLGVSPGVAQWIRNLFVINERVVYLGNWLHGFFAFAAVGATNVGSVNCFYDKVSSTCHHETMFYNERFNLNAILLLKFVAIIVII